MDRKNTRIVSIGNIKIGGGGPVPIQSMTNTKTEEMINAMLKSL